MRFTWGVKLFMTHKEREELRDQRINAYQAKWTRYHRWFAWYPVRCFDTGKVHWFEHVQRKYCSAWGFHIYNPIYASYDDGEFKHS